MSALPEQMAGSLHDRRTALIAALGQEIPPSWRPLSPGAFQKKPSERTRPDALPPTKKSAGATRFGAVDRAIYDASASTASLHERSTVTIATISEEVQATQKLHEPAGLVRSKSQSSILKAARENRPFAESTSTLISQATSAPPIMYASGGSVEPAGPSSAAALAASTSMPRTVRKCPSSVSQQRVNFVLPASSRKTAAGPSPAGGRTMATSLGDTRVWRQDRLRLQLHWPTEIEGFNRPVRSGQKGRREEAGDDEAQPKVRKRAMSVARPRVLQSGKASIERSRSEDEESCATLVHFLEMDPDEVAAGDVGGRSDDESLSSPKGHRSEPVLFCSTCHKPSWAVPTQRYQAPIQIMATGCLETPLWEATTPEMHLMAGTNGTESTGKSKRRRRRGEDWYLSQVHTHYRTKIKSEDINMTDWSVIDPDGRTWLMRVSGEDITAGVLHSNGRVTKYASYDAVERTLLIELRLVGGGKPGSPTSPSIDVAFVLCFFSAVQAIRDELSSGGGRGRRDECGRLITKKSGLKRFVSRCIGI